MKANALSYFFFLVRTWVIGENPRFVHFLSLFLIYGLYTFPT